MIKLQCPCGKTLSLPDKLAGKKVKCKDCAKVMSVPRPSKPTESGRIDRRSQFYIEGLRPCPICDKSYPESVVICTTCGVNIDSGAQLYASLDGGPSPMANMASDEDEPESLSLTQRILALFGIKKG